MRNNVQTIEDPVVGFSITWSRPLMAFFALDAGVHNTFILELHN